MNFSRRPVTDVLIKPVGPDCNLDCEYCFYIEKLKSYPNRTTRMSDTVLAAMIQQLMSQNVPQISIGWQGGEPTLMGLPFYRKAVDLMLRHGRGQSVSNGLQTNGVLIDRDWAKFFRDHHFLIGLSMDGPEHIHDHYRKNRGGHGSWSKALDASELLLEYGVEVNVLSVVNNYSVQFPYEIYEFHKSRGLHFMQFIPCVETEGSTVANFSVDAPSYGAFLKLLFDLWLADFVNGVPLTSIRFFEALLFKYAGFASTECTLLDKCGEYLLIEHMGDVYACDFFVEPEWKLGNLLATPLPTLFNSPKQTNFGQLKADLPTDCRTCEWKTQCRAGCPKDRLRNPALDGRNHFCEAYKLFFAHADSKLRSLADEWKRKQHEPIY
jgi:uncharacterized protein